MDIKHYLPQICILLHFLLITHSFTSARRGHHKKHHRRKGIHLPYGKLRRGRKEHAQKPCVNCDIMDRMLGDQPSTDVKTHDQCRRPCEPCPQLPDVRSCKAGVSFILDGCDCCMICARQQGDMCDHRHTCDPDRKLYCDFTLKGEGQGVCRAIKGRDCEHQDKVYKDGTFFQPVCSQYCTCQNGQVTCSTTCPHEMRPPSSTNCNEPRLVAIDKRCCREWVCPHSSSLIGPDDVFPSQAPQYPKKLCDKETTPWSPCTKSCGVGVSLRHTNDNPECQTETQRRLCLVRPCQLRDKHMPTCQRTWDLNSEKIIRIPERGCESTRKYSLKYCSTCKENKCCGPGDTRTREIQFRCQDGTLETQNFMWIKNCRCVRKSRCPF